LKTLFKTAVVSILCTPGLSVVAKAQLTTITASKIYLSGSLIPAGTVTYTPVSSNGVAIASTQSSGGLNAPTAFSCTVTNRAITGTCQMTYGTTAGTAVQGNDSRIVGIAQTGNNRSDLAKVATARTNLGLGTAAKESTVYDPAGAATSAQAPALAASASPASSVKAVQSNLTATTAIVSAHTATLAGLGIPSTPAATGFGIPVSVTTAASAAATATTIADGALPLSGGTMTSPVVLASDPSASGQAATKNYIDTHSLATSSQVETAIGSGVYPTPAVSASGTPQGVSCSKGDVRYQTDALTASGAAQQWVCSQTGLNWFNQTTKSVVFAGNTNFVGANCQGQYTFVSGVGTDSCSTNNLTTSTAHTDANGVLYSSAADFVALPVSFGAPDVTNLVCYQAPFTNPASGAALIGIHYTGTVDIVEGLLSPIVKLKRPVIFQAGSGTPMEPIVDGSGVYQPFTVAVSTPTCITYQSSSTTNPRIFSSEYEAPGYTVKNPLAATTPTSVWLGSTQTSNAFTIGHAAGVNAGHVYFLQSNAAILTTEQIQHNAAMAKNLIATTKSTTITPGFVGLNDGFPNLIEFGTSLDVGFGGSTALGLGGSLGWTTAQLGGLNYNTVNAGAGAATYCGTTGNSVLGLQLPGLGAIKAFFGSNPNTTVFMGPATNDVTTAVGSGATALACYTQAARTARASGAKVVVSTITPRTDCTGQCLTEEASFNTSVRANWPTYADAMLDLAANPNMSTNSGPGTCYSDHVHMTDFCYKIWSQYQLSALNTLGATSRNSTPHSVASSAEPVFDISLGKMQINTLAADITPSFTNFAPGDVFTLKLTENATGGFTVTWPTANPNFINPPTLVTTPGAINMFTFVIDELGNAVKVPTT
jgi:hypothetical protein